MSYRRNLTQSDPLGLSPLSLQQVQPFFRLKMRQYDEEDDQRVSLQDETQKSFSKLHAQQNRPPGAMRNNSVSRQEREGSFQANLSPLRVWENPSFSAEPGDQHERSRTIPWSSEPSRTPGSALTPKKNPSMARNQSSLRERAEPERLSSPGLPSGPEPSAGTVIQAFEDEDEEQHQQQAAKRQGVRKQQSSKPVPPPPKLMNGFTGGMSGGGDRDSRAEAPKPSVEGPSVANPRSKSLATWEAEVKHLLTVNSREEAVMRPAPSVGMIRCYIRRIKGFFGSHASFMLHLENEDVFLLAARRRKKSKTSSYVLSLDQDDLKRDTDNCLSKLKANFVGTEYMLWGKSEDKNLKKGYGTELCCINFKGTALTRESGPRTLFCSLPVPEAEWQPSKPDGSDSLSVSLEMARARSLAPHLERKLAMLCNKQPEWDEGAKAYMLDFKGRVREASVKNFQLVTWDHNTDRKGVELILQFGKIKEDIFALDFAYPLSALQAFGLALASIDSKLCYAM